MPRALLAVVLVVAGALIGIAASFTGMGGGFLLVPLLLGMRMDATRAVATSFVAILVITISSVSAHALNGNINLWLGGLLGAGGLAGGQLGARLVRLVPTSLFRRFFALLLLALSIWLILNGLLAVDAAAAVASDESPDAVFARLPWLVWVLVPIGFVVGILGSFAGMGGGFLLVPILLACGFPRGICVGSSLFAVLLVSLSALAVHIQRRAMRWRIGLLLGAGGLLGGLAGPSLLVLVSGPLFRIIFGLTLGLIVWRLWTSRK